MIDNYNGFFFPKKDSYMLYKKLDKLIENEGLMRRVGINARKTIVENYSWDKTSSRIAGILGKF